MELIEKQLDSQEIFRGKIITVQRDEVQLADGSRAQREVVRHHGGVAVLAMDQQQRVLFVRQFRYPYGEQLLELPAGKLELGEDPAQCGLRELQEETGYTAGRLEPLGQVYPTPGYLDEVLHLFLAQDLVAGQQQLDPGEFLTVEAIPLQQAVQLCVDGTIRDAKTLVAIMKYALLQAGQ